MIDARLTEILMNVKQQINESKYARESLIAGAFLTGGGANMPNIANVFKEVVGIDKVTVRKNSQSADYILPLGIKNMEARYLAALGLIAGANQTCTADLEEQKDIFTPPIPTDLPSVEEITPPEKSDNDEGGTSKPKKPFWSNFRKKFENLAKNITEE